jgi:hypothetical protein
MRAFVQAFADVFLSWRQRRPDCLFARVAVYFFNFDMSRRGELPTQGCR